jgi:glyoxylase-like metal-dependent hydrolase (beta-lactamase superfamily II)
MFGVVPKNLWSKSNPADDQNRIDMALRALLLRSDDKIILIDSGMGEKYDEKTRSIYKYDNSRFTLLDSLKKLGIEADQVTDIIQTHLHFDHCGGLVSEVDGKLVPTFPNAKVHVQKENLAWARKPTEKDRASYISHDWEPIAAEGMLNEIDGPGEIMPGIELLIFNGHTRAQQLPHIHHEDKHVFFCADLMPTKAHVNLPYVMGYDNFPLTTLEEKKALTPRMYEEKWMLFFEHDPESSFTKLDATSRWFKAGEEVHA